MNFKCIFRLIKISGDFHGNVINQLRESKRKWIGHWWMKENCQIWLGKDIIWPEFGGNREKELENGNGAFAY